MSIATLDDLGTRIAQLRERRGLDRAALAERAGAAESELAAVEAGERGLATSELEAVAEALGVPVDALLHGDEPVAPLFRNEGGDAEASEAVREFESVMDDF